MLRRVLCKTISSANFPSKNAKKRIPDFYCGNSTIKIKLTFFNQFISFTCNRCEFKINDISNKEYEFFSCRVFVDFCYLIEYLNNSLSKS